MVSERQEMHAEVRKLMAQGQFAEALQLSKDVIKTHGPHLSLMADLTSCQYMVGDYRAYLENTVQLNIEFHELYNKLKPETQLAVGFALGKLLEEIGFIHSAKQIFTTLLKKDFTGDHLDMIQAQYLRLLCLFPTNEDSGKAYAICERLRTQNKNVAFEITFSLIHADFHFLGLKAALEKIRNLLSDSETADYLKRLVAFDFLFECLRSKSVALFPKSYLETIDYWSCDPYEKGLWDLLSLSIGENTHAEVTIDRSADLSPLGALRYLTLLSTCLDTDVALMAEKKRALLLQTIEAKSRPLLEKAWPVGLSQDVSSALLVNNSKVIRGSQSVDLGNAPVVLQLLTALAHCDALSAEEAIEKIYGVPFTESSFHRLRMLVKRANQKLFLLTRQSATITLKKFTLSSKNTIELQRAS